MATARPQRIDVHGPGPGGGGEFALCGDAFDAYESGDADEPILFAGPGDRVTCPRCREVIDHVRANFRRYAYRPGD